MTERSLLKAHRLPLSKERQRGSALIVSLIMLLLITLVAVAGMQTTIMQERMSANLYDRELAFQAAEAALREGEALIMTGSEPVITNSNGLYVLDHANRPQWGGGASTASAAAITYPGTLRGVVQNPQYFVEHITTLLPPGTPTDVFVPPPYYRITARGFGGSQETVVVVTSVVRAIP